MFLHSTTGSFSCSDSAGTLLEETGGKWNMRRMENSPLNFWRENLGKSFSPSDDKLKEVTNEMKFVTELCNYNLREMKILLLVAFVNYAMFSDVERRGREKFNENMMKAMKSFLINSPFFFAWSVSWTFSFCLHSTELFRCVHKFMIMNVH